MRNPKERGRKKKEEKIKKKKKKPGVPLLQIQTSVGQFFAFMPNLWFWF